MNLGDELQSCHALGVCEACGNDVVCYSWGPSCNERDFALNALALLLLLLTSSAQFAVSS